MGLTLLCPWGHLREYWAFQGGPRDAAGKLLGGPHVLSLSDLVGRFDAWVVAYNRRRAHSGLGGATPEQRWLFDAAPLRTVPPAELRWLLLEEQTRKVAKSGIRFHCLDFVAPELNGLVGETVDVRYRPHDDTSIEVFRNGVHLCAALPQGALGEAERAAVLDRRRQDAARQGALARRANRRARERFAPMTRPGDPEEATVVSARQADRESARDDPERLRRVARGDLLGLPSRQRR
jgi:putative transposase